MIFQLYDRIIGMLCKVMKDIRKEIALKNRRIENE